MAYKGALVVKMNADQSIPNSTNGVMVTYDTVIRDTEGFFNPTYPTRFTIPAGITKVRLMGQQVFASNTTGLRQAVIRKNYPTPPASSLAGDLAPGWYYGVPATTALANGGTTSDMQIQTPVLDVYEGDIFEYEVHQASGGSLNLLASRGVWFEIEVIEEGDNTRPSDPEPEEDWNEVFTETVATDMGPWSGQTFVGVIKASSLGTLPTGTQTEIEVTFNAGSGGFGASSAFIGHRASSGDNYDFAATPAQLKDGVSNTFTVPSGGSKTVKATFTYDGVSDLVVAISHDGTSANNLKAKVGTGNVYKGYYKSSTTDAGTVNKSGYADLGGSGSLNQHCIVSKISMDGF